MLTQFYIALGTNLGDRRANLSQAIALLAERITIMQTSSIYETAAAYVEDQPVFLNMVLLGAAQSEIMPPRALLQLAQSIEQRMHRQRLVRYGPRIIDVDVLTYGDVHIIEPDLIIPHPRIAERDFVLVPWMEIAPDYIYPGQTLTVAQLAQRSPGVGKVLNVGGPVIGT